MELRTPKKYKRGKQRPRYVGSWRGIRNLLVIAFLVLLAYWGYQNQTAVREQINQAQGQVPGIINQAQTAIPRAPTATPNVENDIVEARMAYQTGEYERAIESYRRVLGGRPNDLESHYRLAMLLTITSDFGNDPTKLEEAVDVAERAINAAPEAPEGWSVRALALAWMDRYGEAIAYAQRALEIDPNFVQAQAVLAQAYLSIDSNSIERQATANELIQEAVSYLQGVGSATNETVALVFRTDGYIAERLLQRERAIESYEFAQQAAPEHTYITAELALSYWGNGQIELAVELLNESLQTSPRDPTLLFQLGRLYLNQGERESALDAFQRCIQFNPTASECYAWLGGMQYYSANYTVAIENLENAIANDTDDLDVWWQLARSYAQTGYCNLAVPIYREGYSRATGNGEIQNRIQSFILEDCNEPIIANPATPAPTTP